MSLLHRSISPTFSRRGAQKSLIYRFAPTALFPIIAFSDRKKEIVPKRP